MRRTVGIWWLVLTAVAIAVLAPLPYVSESLTNLAAADSDLALNYVDRPTWVQGFFYAHIAGGGVALLLSPVQLSAILVGGVAGLVLAPFNMAGTGRHGRVRSARRTVVSVRSTWFPRDSGR